MRWETAWGSLVVVSDHHMPRLVLESCGKAPLRDSSTSVGGDLLA